MFNIRIYGILREAGRLLVTDEFRLGIRMTKFPGGGLEFGEGPFDCLKREWLEETGFAIEISSHYYTTEFFQPSYRLPESQQIISIYYLVKAKGLISIPVTEKKFDFPELRDGIQTFRWLDLGSLSAEDFTLPIDRVVAEKLRQDHSNGLI